MTTKELKTRSESQVSGATPGPWKAKRGKKETHQGRFKPLKMEEWEIRGGPNDMIVASTGLGIVNGAARADARLIAAAPDLVNIALKIVTVRQDLGADELKAWCAEIAEEARKALVKAFNGKMPP